jgi:hypothetical protein
VRTAGVSADQTELTLAADHARWLRDKQSDVYVAMIRFVQDATMHRADVIRYIEHNLYLPEEIHETIASYEGQPLRDLLVMAQAHASREVGDSFRQATEADLAVWNRLTAAVESTGPMVISADLSQAARPRLRAAAWTQLPRDHYVRLNSSDYSVRPNVIATST